MITYAADEAAALYDDVDMGGYEELDAAAEGVDVNYFVFSNHGLAQVHADAAAEGIESGTVERLTTIDVLVAAVVDRAADSLAVLADGQRALQPKATGRRVSGNLVGVATVAVNDGYRAHVEQ